MKKETLKFENVLQDMRRVADVHIVNTSTWRYNYIISFAVLSVFIGILLKNIWVGLFIFSAAVYHIVRFVMEVRDHKSKKTSIMAAVDRADISISIEKLTHIATETSYGPHHYNSRRRSGMITENVFYFASGNGWKAPVIFTSRYGYTYNSYKHYPWSKEYYLSHEGLENLSIEGDEFYYVTLQGDCDISYIYPCKIFVLDERLNTKL